MVLISQRPRPPHAPETSLDPSLRSDATLEQSPLILIVEDDIDNRELLEAILRFEGFRTATAASGNEALKAFESHLPDVVLLDLGLPDTNGLKVAELMRKSDSPQRVYLVALTGSDDATARRATSTAGFDAHVAKPVSMERLLTLIRARHSSDEMRAVGQSR